MKEPPLTPPQGEDSGARVPSLEGRVRERLRVKNAEGIASSSSAVGEAGADIKELRERSGN